MKQPKELFTQSKLEKLKLRRNQIAHIVLLDTMQTRARFGVLEKWKLDHVSAWIKGGATSVKNCEMLCKTHNRAKEIVNVLKA